jgi:aspartate aminotransferase
MSTLLETARASRLRAASRLDGIAVSDIVQIKARAAELERAGRDIIDLSIGEPDFDTPSHILQAAAEAMAQGRTHYTATAGTMELRQAVVDKVARHNDRRILPNSVFIGVGAKQVIANALLATLEPRDEVIIPAPFWSNYVDIVRLAGGRPSIVPCPQADGYLLTAEALRRALTARTRWVMLNSPSNPTGATYGRSALQDIAEVVRAEPELMLIEDAIYEHLVYEDGYHSILDVAPDLAERVLWINGVSKAYAMTGWRIGYGVGPRWLIDAMTVIAAQTTSHPCSIAQAAAVAALNGPDAPVHHFRDQFAERRRIVLDAFSEIESLSVLPPAGAFYAFPSLRRLMGRRSRSGRGIASDRDLVDILLEDASVAVVPGSSFGAPGNFRLSFAAAPDRLREACARIRIAIAGLRGD